MAKRYSLCLDLKEDAALIAEYEAYHRAVWPEVLASITDSGILNMEIYRWRNRLFMTMQTTDNFTFEAKAVADAANPKVQEWETLMWKYQQGLPGVPAGEKWQLMEKIFEL